MRLRKKRGASDGAAECVKNAWLVMVRIVEPPTDETIEALTFLAEYYKNKGFLDKAEKCCMNLLEVVGSSPQKNAEALAIMREIRSMRSG